MKYSTDGRSIMATDAEQDALDAQMCACIEVSKALESPRLEEPLALCLAFVNMASEELDKAHTQSIQASTALDAEVTSETLMAAIPTVGRLYKARFRMLIAELCVARVRLAKERPQMPLNTPG